MAKSKKIEDVLREAAAAVEAAGLPEDLRSAAFTKAVDLIAGTPATAAPADVPETRPESKRTSGATQPLDMIAEKFEIDLDVVDEAFEVEDGAPKLIIPRSKLANSTKAAARQIALLVAASRQAAGVEQLTESSVLAEAAKSYNKFDSGNFAKAIVGLDDDFSYSGARQSRKVKVRRDGYKNAGQLVKTLLGKSEA